MNNGITKENLLFARPIALRGDESTEALAEATAEVLAARLAEIDRLRIISNIDNLEEALLDILARDFKVDWWDANYSLEEKRRTLKDSWRVHKMLGTKAAVETAISAIYPRTKVLEWWEYGGEPYHFRLDINITNDTIDSDKQRRVLERVNFYKSLRSHNDGVTYFVEAEPAIIRAGGYTPGLWEAVQVPMELLVPIIRPEAIARLGSTTGVWEAVHVPLELPVPAIRREATVRVGSVTGMAESFAAAAVFPVAVIKSPATVHIGAVAALEESHTTLITLTGTEPVRSAAELRTTASSMWQESYRTGNIVLAKTVLTAALQAQAASGVASTQETAQTHINLQEVDNG